MTAAIMAFAAPGAVMIVAVALIAAALVFYLVSTIVALRKVSAGLDDVVAGVDALVRQTIPVDYLVTSINEQLDAGVEVLEGLLVKKAGMTDAVGLVEGLYPGAGAEGFRHLPESRNTDAQPITGAYTKGSVTPEVIHYRRTGPSTTG